MDLLLVLGPLVLGAATAIAVDWSAERRGLQAPALSLRSAPTTGRALRRAFLLTVMTVGLALAVFQSITALGVETEVDMSQVATWQLFFVHAVLMGMMGLWYLVGFGGHLAPPRRLATEWWRQFGLRSTSIGREILLGLAVGAVGWFVVLAVVSLLGLLAGSLIGPESLPDGVPEQVVWMAGLPVLLRFAIAVSAGVVEEVFFRGFLQPRIGILASTGLFSVAHLSYGQPFLLVGVTLLSVGFAFLSRWRGNVWAAITAHFAFDAIQLLVLIPAALRFAELAPPVGG